MLPLYPSACLISKAREGAKQQALPEAAIAGMGEGLAAMLFS